MSLKTSALPCHASDHLSLYTPPKQGGKKLIWRLDGICYSGFILPKSISHFVLQLWLDSSLINASLFR